MEICLKVFASVKISSNLGSVGSRSSEVSQFSAKLMAACGGGKTFILIESRLTCASLGAKYCSTRGIAGCLNVNERTPWISGAKWSRTVRRNVVLVHSKPRLRSRFTPVKRVLMRRRKSTVCASKWLNAMSLSHYQIK